MNNENLIDINNLSVKYVGSEKYALKNINLSIKKGDFICIMGSAGAGKTTLALCLNGLIPNSIRVNMEGEVNVMGLNTRNNKVAVFSPYVGIVFQDPDAQLFCSTVEEEVGFILSNRELPIKLIKQKVKDTLSKLRLEGFEKRLPHSLSGGEKQLVAIASVLSMNPQILVLDEPTSQLDPIGTTKIFKVIKELVNKEKITVIMMEHKSEEIAEVADKIIILKDGEIVLQGDPEKIFSTENLLEQYGVRPPQVSEATSSLISKGCIFPFFPINYEDGITTFRKKLRS